MSCDEYRKQYDQYWNVNTLPHSPHPPGFWEWHGHQTKCSACQEFNRRGQALKKGVDPERQCCLSMAYHISEGIEGGQQDKPNVVILWIESWDEYMIPVSIQGHRATPIEYCPWCARKLPQSKQKVWWETLREMGFTDPGG